MAKKIIGPVEDIFGGIDRTGAKKPTAQAVKRQTGQPSQAKPAPVSQPVSQGPEQEPVGASSGIMGNRRFVIAGIALVVVLCAAGAMAAWRGGLFTKNIATTSKENTNSPAVVNDNSASAAVNIVPVNAGPADTDSDGLADAEEKSLGTDIQAADTDGDGLFDREEVKVYKTDPLKKDTDGDGQDDGTEVRNGYNPAGQGKLFDLTNALSNTNK